MQQKALSAKIWGVALIALMIHRHTLGYEMYQYVNICSWVHFFGIEFFLWIEHLLILCLHLPFVD